MHRIASFSRASATSSPAPEVRYPDDIEALLFPIEISQSIQAFLNNLTSPIHKAPFSPERLTAMFQDFYAGTFEQTYDILPEDVKSPADSGEMLSTEEIATLKLRRQQAEVKRQQWKEEIEARVCLEMYDKIFELKTSTDELRDEALMSKIIAMNLIGVSLEQLGVGLSDKEWSEMQPTVSLIGEELQGLNNSLTPKSKIDVLVACHKKIVDEVQHTNIADDLANAIAGGEAASVKSLEIRVESDNTRKHLGADAILPILIYSIIKSNPAKLVSHFQYIQRFRASTLLSGEAAYCLTNVEAAIGFLETFDDGHPSDADPLRAGNSASSLKASNSTASLATSIRAGDRARALSSAAQDVYDFADERMKFLGSQFGTQLGALVNRVSQNHDLAEVRSLMGLPEVEEEKTSSGFPSTLSINESSRVLSPSKPQSTVQTQPTKVGGGFGRLTGLGMIRNLSNSFTQTRGTEASKQRELHTVRQHLCAH